MNEWSYVTAAYAVTWVVMLGYCIWLEFGVVRRARQRLRAATGEAGQ